MTASAPWCAIDFGTSNSAIALPADGEAGVRLVPLEGEHVTMPTAVFYAADEERPHAAPRQLYGRAALAAYVDGLDGRLMRSMKSILGSPLAEQHTDVGGGRAVRFLDVVAGYLRHLKAVAEAQAGRPLQRVVLGRPVFFVDDDPAADHAAQQALERAAREVGFGEVHFQYEPIAAALDFERGATTEQRVLVADIGGGTSDFSLVRVGPGRRDRLERQDDILANHGVHTAGTDFDRRVALEGVYPLLGHRGRSPEGREVPSRVYFDLSTWHRINTVYAPQRLAELRRMRDFYAEPAHHRRLMAVLDERLGHALLGRAEAAKIAVAEHGRADIDLSLIEPGLHVALDEPRLLQALAADLDRIVAAARTTVQDAGVAPDAVDALYFTGGSTGLGPLTQRLAAAFPRAVARHGDRFASVSQGLGEHARRLFATA
ncbi:Hsp70 family protein [Aquabacterium sp. J223]|uniref:Hsp70 family protein n=1 Tax=Aquabacterium sp. J223 TaxID=2898431 RepID=UPI0021ADD788|nr:Hsp70 family protein [Aquabacterium sp. J223]UUX95942.1 Hsp70 family protein [Aquabacterium sp. J223]